MESGRSIVGDNIELWAKIDLAPAFSGPGRFMYTSIEFRDTRQGTLDWKQIKTKVVPARLLKTTPLFLSKKHGDLKAFLRVPEEIRIDFERINIKQAKEIQALVMNYKRNRLNDPVDA